MKNIFKLEESELKEYHKKINLLTKYFNYTRYKWFWNIVIKEDINLDDMEDILTLDRPWSFVEDNMTDEEYEAYEEIYDFLLDAFYRKIGKCCSVEEIDTCDEYFSKNPYYVGYKISYEGRSLCFYDGYTGVAGCHWDTVAFKYWFEDNK